MNQNRVMVTDDSLSSDILIASQVIHTIPTELPASVVSSHVREVFDIVNYVTISAAIGVFGICANVINITVFIKQGFHDVITISLLALAISDLCALLAMEIYDIFINPYVRSADLPFLPMEIKYVIASWPHSCFTRITCLLTAFITLERCLCISIPLKVKSFLSPKRVTFAVVLIFVSVFISVIPAYFTVELKWRFDSNTNRTVLGVEKKEDIQRIADIAFVVNCIMQFVAFGSVVVSTAILVVKLKKQAKWRNSAASSGTTEKKGSSSSISPKDAKLIRMVIIISVILILCCTPGSSCFITALFVPGFSADGIYQNIYFVAWSFAFVTDAINPSVNIFIYYNMSSRYRITFRKLFHFCFKESLESCESTTGSSVYTTHQTVRDKTTD